MVKVSAPTGLPSAMANRPAATTTPSLFCAWIGTKSPMSSSTSKNLFMISSSRKAGRRPSIIDESSRTLEVTARTAAGRPPQLTPDVLKRRDQQKRHADHQGQINVDPLVAHVAGVAPPD